ncbi:sensor histidine kinase [Mogibacterium sp.]|uniref:sensor histidine kinase n=1 Tax=Mogibacterium sp. TaxID=2049035 RepID=UPI00257DF6EE|nr:sensor histidine kinase [Mogibacterium sp.]
MNSYLDRIKNVLMIALIISVAAQINIDAPHVAPGFVFAIDVIVLDVFIFCFLDKYTAMQIALISAVFSPTFRFITSMKAGVSMVENAVNCFPDAIFFIIYGIIISLCVKAYMGRRIPLLNFCISVFLADFLGNIIEVYFMSIIRADNFVTMYMFNTLLVIALARTGISLFIIVTMEYYMHVQTERAHNRKIQFMVNQSVTIADEMRFILNNKEDVERVLKEAYALHTDMKDADMPEEFTKRALEIARGTHEIKGCYQEILDTLDNLNRNAHGEPDLLMSEILKFMKSNILKTAAAKHMDVEFEIDQRMDYKVSESYKTISILRNLTVNALEAFEGSDGKIRVMVAWCRYSSIGPCHRIEVEDNGPGIDEADTETIFLPGYSTKMNMDTGFVQRGLGLSLVRDYVENDFGGRIRVKNRKDGGTRFVIEIPPSKFEEETRWIFTS